MIIDVNSLGDDIPKYKARIVYSGKDKPEVPENVEDDIERDEYVSMPLVSEWNARIRVKSVQRASLNLFP